MDGAEAGTVAGSHVLVQRVDSGGSRQLTVLLVHVVSTGSRVVSDPDTEVLDLQGVLLVDLVERDDLAVGLLDLLELGQEVPEAGLGDNVVGSEDTHAVELRGGVGLVGEEAPNNLVLLKTTCEKTAGLAIQVLPPSNSCGQPLDGGEEDQNIAARRIVSQFLRTDPATQFKAFDKQSSTTRPICEFQVGKWLNRFCSKSKPETDHLLGSAHRVSSTLPIAVAFEGLAACRPCLSLLVKIFVLVVVFVSIVIDPQSQLLLLLRQQFKVPQIQKRK